MRRTLLALLLTLLVPVAAAQAPTASLNFENAPQKHIATDATQLVPIKVVLMVSNVVCTGNAPMKVLITSQATMPTNASSNATVSAIPSPTELTFTVPQGAYGQNPALPTAKPFRGEQTVTIAVKANVTNATTVDVAYAAKFDGYSGMECRGSAGIGAATKDGSFKVDFPATAQVVPTQGPELPLPPALVFLALAGGLFLMRRRST